MATMQSAYFNKSSGLRGSVRGVSINISGSESGTWYTVAIGNAQTTGLRIESISGHNSSIFNYSGNVSTYLYQVATDTIRTVYDGTTNGGAHSCRLVANPTGANGLWYLQVKINSSLGTEIMIYIGAGIVQDDGNTDGWKEGTL